MMAKCYDFVKIGLLCVAIVMVAIFVNPNSGNCWDAPKIEKPVQFPNYPERPIDFICSWGVGGGADTMSRKLSELVEKYYDINLVVTNMPGAAGTKGVEHAMSQPADGYTIFFAAWDCYMNYILGKSEFGPPHIDVILLGQYVPGAYFVQKESQFKTFEQLIDYSKKHPYKLKLADVGRGGLGDLTLALWEKCKGLKLTYVPYDKPSRRYSSFAGGHVDILYEQPGDITHLLEQGARPLVFMAEERLPQFPNTPTAKELGCDITLALWRGVGLNEKIHEQKIKYLTEIFGSITKSPEWNNFLKQMMVDPTMTKYGEAANKCYEEEYEIVKKLKK